MTWNEVQTLFITKFRDERNKFRHRMVVEPCIRADEEEIRNFFHRTEKTVDQYGWSHSGQPECGTFRKSSATKTKILWLHTEKAQTNVSTTKGYRIFDGISKCNLERSLNTLKQRRRNLSSLYQLPKWRRTEQGSGGLSGTRI